MAKLRNDLTGKVFGYLEVISFHERVKGKARWLCKCKCGANAIVEGTQLGSGNTKSCGCLKFESRNVRHGMSKTRIHRIWRGMMNRCYNKNDQVYKRYGARGITVCERWHTFENFLADMGEPPDGLTIDRVDNDGSYEPSNCEWATDLQQSNNRGCVIRLTVGDQTKTIRAWSDETGLAPGTIASRIRLGWSPDRCILPLDAVKRTITERDASGRIVRSA